MNKQEFIEELKTTLKTILIIGIACGLMYLFRITCPIKYVTGISCAGCGMTRACLAALHGNFHEAFAFHPLFFLVPLAPVIYLFREKLPRPVLYILIFTTLAAFVIVYVYRLADPTDSVVVFDPGHSLVYRIISLLKGGI